LIIRTSSSSVIAQLGVVALDFRISINMSRKSTLGLANFT